MADTVREPGTSGTEQIADGIEGIPRAHLFVLMSVLANARTLRRHRKRLVVVNQRPVARGKRRMNRFAQAQPALPGRAIRDVQAGVLTEP
jgi:hypothetical protein